MTPPEGSDPRRPLRDAALVSRLLGGLLVLIGIGLIVPLLTGRAVGDPATIFFGALIVIFFAGAGCIYLVAGHHVARARRWAAVLGMTVAGVQLPLACVATAMAIYAGPGPLSIMLAMDLAFGFALVYMINALRAMSLPEISEARGFEPILPPPAVRAGGGDGEQSN